MSRSFKAEILENKPLLRDVNLLRVLPLSSIMNPEPGHFFMVQSGFSNDPLLKRPFCIFASDTNEISFLFRIRGRGTELLSRIAPGNVLEILGPLGNAYPMVGKRPVIAVGGIGIASLFPLVRKLSEKAVVIYGARTKSELLFEDRLKLYARETHIITDDGSAGDKGTVTEYLCNHLASDGEVVVYACGPQAMLKNVSLICEARKVECYMSLEENMACGIGSCLGCAVRTKDGYRRVCKEGPVFSASDLVWD